MVLTLPASRSPLQLSSHVSHKHAGAAVRSAVTPSQSAAASRRRQAAAAAGGGGAGPLIDPTAGRRTTVVPSRLDPHTLNDVRQAEAAGPRGLLLIGFDQGDFAKVAAWFQAMEPGFAVACCPAALLADGSAATLHQALGGASAGSSASELPAALAAAAWQAAPAGTPPVAFLSGLSGQEQVALMEGWEAASGVQAPAFASVTPTILAKPLGRLLADIVRAQAQAPPPGLAGLSPAELEAARAEHAAAAAAAGAPSASSSSGGSAAEEVAMRGKLADYVMVDKDGKAAAAPMSMDELREQVQEKMRQKRAAQAAEEKAARREASADETDRMRQALQAGKKGGAKKGGAKGGKPGGGGGKGFGS